MSNVKVKIGNIYNLTSGRPAEVIQLLPKGRCRIKIIGTEYEQECLRFKLSQNGVRDNFFPVVCGVGFIGEGPYKAFINNRSTKAYTNWTHMLERCYDSLKVNSPTYQDVDVCQEWHNFQNFADWFYKQIGHDKPKWHIEKDIYFFHTSIATYSPESCFFVPQQLNNQFLLREADRGCLPLGVREEKGKFYARVQFKNFRSHSPRYSDIQDAIDWYFEQKSLVIGELADEFKDELDPRCYELLKTIKLFDPAIV